MKYLCLTYDEKSPRKLLAGAVQSVGEDGEDDGDNERGDEEGQADDVEGQRWIFRRLDGFAAHVEVLSR